MEGEPRSDAELLAATGREPETFGAFYRRHAEPVLAYLLAQTRRPDVAADLTAEVFATALERRRRFDPARGPGRAWLLVLARSLWIDSLRRGQVEDRARRRLGMPAREFAEDDFARVDALLDLERGLDLDRLVADLPAEQRAAVLARVVDERDYRDIACELHISEAAVRQRVARGLTVLRTRVRAAEAQP